MSWEPAIPEPAPRPATKATCEICGGELRRDKALDTAQHLGYRCNKCRMTARRRRPEPKEAKK